MHTLSLLFVCFLGFQLTSCAGHSNTAIAPPDEPVATQSGFAPGYHNYVANRTFSVRSTPRLSGTELIRISEGQVIKAIIVFHDEVWNYIEMDDGNTGYVFGTPLTPRRSGYYPITD
jgi:hypothetical protein